MIHIDAIDEYRNVFDNFIILLATVIQKTNSFSDCYARQMACESLRELEMTYPCLLAGFVEDILEDKELFDQSMAMPSLFKLCHAERSHTSPSYTVLLLSILEHCATRKFSKRIEDANFFYVLAKEIHQRKILSNQWTAAHQLQKHPIPMHSPLLHRLEETMMAVLRLQNVSHLPNILRRVRRRVFNHCQLH